MYFFAIIIVLACTVTVSSFRFGRLLSTTRMNSLLSSTPDDSTPTTKGFGAPKQKVVVTEEEKDAGTKTYEAQSKRGVPEYNIFMRPLNGTEGEWVPVGSMVNFIWLK